MSKMDALRAMREARFEQDRTRAGQTPRKPLPQPTPASAPAAAATVEAEETDDGLCGHRNMGGRTCTRERGHTAKSHRYS